MAVHVSDSILEERFGYGADESPCILIFSPLEARLLPRCFVNSSPCKTKLTEQESHSNARKRRRLQDRFRQGLADEHRGNDDISSPTGSLQRWEAIKTMEPRLSSAASEASGDLCIFYRDISIYCKNGGRFVQLDLAFLYSLFYGCFRQVLVD